jgi:hypothetical protein
MHLTVRKHTVALAIIAATIATALVVTVVRAEAKMARSWKPTASTTGGYASGTLSWAPNGRGSYKASFTGTLTDTRRDRMCAVAYIGFYDAARGGRWTKEEVGTACDEHRTARLRWHNAMAKDARLLVSRESLVIVG